MIKLNLSKKMYINTAYYYTMYYKGVRRNIAHGSHYHKACSLAVLTENAYIHIYINKEITYMVKSKKC